MAKETFAETSIGCGMGLLAFPVLAILYAVALKYGWNSIFVPTLAVPTINGFEAYGITMVVKFITIPSSVAFLKKEDKTALQGAIEGIVVDIVRPLMFMLFIWILLWIAGPAIGAN